jgi:(p)ppGpp synthase/HD superfamily hydrolase
MTEQMQYELALKIATKAHEGQLDKSGVDYIKHPIAVASFCHTFRAKIVALLHDTIEDTYVTKDFLLQQGLDEDIVEAVALLSKWEGFDETRDSVAYMTAIKKNPLAREVKLCDLLHNMDPTRTMKDMEWKVQKTRIYYREFLYLFVDDMETF